MGSGLDTRLPVPAALSAVRFMASSPVKGAAVNDQPDAYIWVNGWEKFQKYQAKRGKPWAPPWIRLYHEVWSNDDFLELPESTRLLLLGLWSLFAHHKLTVRSGRTHLQRQLNMRVNSSQLERLNHAGFIDFCSGTVLEQRKNAFWNGSALELEVEVEVDKDPSVQPVARPLENGRTEGAIAFDYQNILQDMPL